MHTKQTAANNVEVSSLGSQLQIVRDDPVVTQMMKMVSDGLVVLNEQGQIMEANSAFLKILKIKDKNSIIGKRPGDAIECVHTIGVDGGCGNTGYCTTCGAAMVILNSLGEGTEKEAKCIATVVRNKKQLDICFKVRSYPMPIKGQPFVFLFFEDITDDEWRFALEQIFFHDINNIITGMGGISHMVEKRLDPEHKNVIKPLNLLITRLSQEIKLQNFLTNTNYAKYHLNSKNISLNEVIEEVSLFFSSHPLAKGITLKLPSEIPDLTLKTDATLLHRVLVNMLKNAFEASETGGLVKLLITYEIAGVTFIVWNKQHIPDNIALRIFQRHFSTKSEPGRGFGTYAMKLVTENFLKGEIDFTSSPKTGTIFRLKIPYL